MVVVKVSYVYFIHNSLAFKSAILFKKKIKNNNNKLTDFLSVRTKRIKT